MVLEEYKDILSVIASSATIPLMLSPSLICRQFMKKGSSDHIKPFTFVGGWCRCAIFLQFGILSGINALIRIHSLGLLLFTIYLILYNNYCKNKAPLVSTLTKGIFFVSVLLGFANFKKDSFVTANFGSIATIVHLTILAAPLLNLKNVIRTKSTAGMPFPMIFCATVVSVAWLLYGLSIHNTPIIIQMVVSTLLTGFQLSLFVIYSSKSPQEKKDQSEVKKNKSEVKKDK